MVVKAMVKKVQTINWWNPNLADVEDYGPAAKMLLSYAVANANTVHVGTCKGILADEEEEGAKEKFLAALAEVTGAATPFTSCPIFGRGNYDTWMVWDEGSITVREGADSKFDIKIATMNSDTYSDVIKLLGDYLLPEYVRQPIYSLAKGTNGSIEIGEVGVAGVPFERENYTEQVAEEFNFITEELQRTNPLGRLTIVSGDPGTGKTFFVRGLINEVLDAVFVLIPPNMVEQLSGPELVPMLIRARSLIGVEKPLVLVIEDADKALVPRKDGDLAAISSLLNVSDGILGHALNLRILCTTNAELKEIDEALLRPGRLSKHIHIGLTPLDKAVEIFSRLTEGMEVTFGSEHANGIALAQIYEFAKQVEIEEEIEDEDDEDSYEEDEDEEDEDEEDED